MPERYIKNKVGLLTSIFEIKSAFELVKGVRSDSESDLMLLGLNHGEELVNAFDELLNDYNVDMSGWRRAEFETLLAKCKQRGE